MMMTDHLQFLEFFLRLSMRVSNQLTSSRHGNRLRFTPSSLHSFFPSFFPFFLLSFLHSLSFYLLSNHSSQQHPLQNHSIVSLFFPIFPIPLLFFSLSRPCFPFPISLSVQIVSHLSFQSFFFKRINSHSIVFTLSLLSSLSCLFSSSLSIFAFLFFLSLLPCSLFLCFPVFHFLKPRLCQPH